jgi:hypothetical protein
MARNDQRNAVLRHRVPHRPGSSRRPRTGRQLGITERLTVGNPATPLQDATLKFGGLTQIDPNIPKVVRMAICIGTQPVDQGIRGRRIRIRGTAFPKKLRETPQRLARRRMPESQRGQPSPRPRRGDPAQGSRKDRATLSFHRSPFSGRMLLRPSRYFDSFHDHQLYLEFVRVMRSPPPERLTSDLSVRRSPR